MIRQLDRFTRNCYPGVACAAVILLLTGLPGSYLPKVKPVIGLDKVVHLLMYLGFAYLTLWGYRKPYMGKGKAYRRKLLWLTFAIGIVYGAFTEIMQETFVPGRVGSVFDWIADLIGTLMGVVFFHFLHRNRNKMENAAYYK